MCPLAMEEVAVVSWTFDGVREGWRAVVEISGDVPGDGVNGDGWRDIPFAALDGPSVQQESA